MNENIVILINSLDGGGAERVVSVLLNNLCAKYRCYVILLENRIKYDLDESITILHLNEIPTYRGVIKFIRFPIVAYKVAKLIKTYKFKKVTSFLYRSNIINIISTAWSGHTVTINERIYPSSMYNASNIKSFINKLLIKNIYRKADEVIAVSKGVKKDLLDNYGLKNKISVIYNPYDIDKIKKQSLESCGTNKYRYKNIICVSSFSERKNHQMLLHAFKSLRSEGMVLNLIGEGALQCEVKKLVKELEIEDKVKFLGFKENPYKFMKSSSIFVLPSNSEGFPNVIVEALICGCAVIATDCMSGPREILAPDTDYTKHLYGDKVEYARYGVLIPVNNANMLAKSIDELVTDNKKLNYYEKVGLNRALEFQESDVIEKYKKLIGQ